MLCAMPAPENLAAWRRAQRNALLARRMALAPDLRAQYQATITATLLAQFSPEPNAVVALYWPFKGEFDPRHVVRQWRERGARSVLPVVLAKAQPLQFREWWPGVATRPGVFDLPVPQDTAVLVPDLILMPPIGFDAQCYRLGYGGGYYDRTLADLRGRKVQRIGVGFELGRIDTIHPQNYDIPMDLVVTEAGVFRPRK